MSCKTLDFLIERKTNEEIYLPLIFTLLHLVGLCWTGQYR